jgi:hypothetical protein
LVARLGKQRVRLEIRRERHLEAHDIGWIICILFTALVALHRNEEVDRRRRGKSVGLTERDFMATGEILLVVELVVLADDDPAIVV